MTYRIIITANAHKDIQQAIAWEDGRSTGLGRRFFLDLEQRLNSIALVPNLGSIYYDNVRCTSTKTFQYLIHYIIHEQLQQLVVLRVLHTSRNPTWDL